MLEREFGHDRVQGAHHEREGVARPERTPSRAELRQEERTGIRAKDVRADVTAAYRASDDPDAFVSALEDKGYFVAHGSRRDHVVIDPAGGIHSLARRIEDVRAAELRQFMASVDPAKIMSIEDAQRHAAEWRRQQQQSEIEADDRKRGIGEDYLTGADYVSQSRAAQRDFQERQERLNSFRRVIDRPEQPDKEGKSREADTANPYRRSWDNDRGRDR